MHWVPSQDGARNLRAVADVARDREGLRRDDPAVRSGRSGLVVVVQRVGVLHALGPAPDVRRRHGIQQLHARKRLSHVPVDVARVQGRLGARRCLGHASPRSAWHPAIAILYMKALLALTAPASTDPAPSAPPSRSARGPMRLPGPLDPGLPHQMHQFLAPEVEASASSVAAARNGASGFRGWARGGAEWSGWSWRGRGARRGGWWVSPWGARGRARR